MAKQSSAPPIPISRWSPLLSEPIDPADAVDYAQVFKALSDPVRLRLFSLIASRDGGEVCVCELTKQFEVTGPTISHHLKVLRETGLVGSQRRGTWVYYWVYPQTLTRLGRVFSPA
ncbi:ArsR/SmtB family transcription factor [Solwaraspora sp. WMMB762]|uniref:ArsR/SmtB family transcription factor n=1 Tax=Solwaraspora sp. WMMB762 TaxID=3404120 RepID=UPI003B92750F